MTSVFTRAEDAFKVKLHNINWTSAEFQREYLFVEDASSNMEDRFLAVIDLFSVTASVK